MPRAKSITISPEDAATIKRISADLLLMAVATQKLAAQAEALTVKLKDLTAKADRASETLFAIGEKKPTGGKR